MPLPKQSDIQEGKSVSAVKHETATGHSVTTTVRAAVKILQVNGAARSSGANSTRLANAITARLLALNPAASVTLRDLSVNPQPMLDDAGFAALFTPAER